MGRVAWKVGASWVRVAAEGTKQYMTGPYEFIDLDAGHWIIQEAFDKVVGPITAHLKRNGG